MKHDGFAASLPAIPSPCRVRPSIGATSIRSSVGSSTGSASLPKDLVPLARDKAKQDPLFCAIIRRSFGGAYFHGKVCGIDVDVHTAERAYHIIYEDGDEEHLSALEVRQSMVVADVVGLMSAAGSRRVSIATIATQPFSSAPTPRQSMSGTQFKQPSFSGITGFRYPGLHAGASVIPSLATQALNSPWMALVVAMLALVLVLHFGWNSLAGSVTDGQGTRVGVAGLSPPLPPWAQYSPQATQIQDSWLQNEATAAAMAAAQPSSEQLVEQSSHSSTSVEPEHPPAAELPSWAAKAEEPNEPFEIDTSDISQQDASEKQQETPTHLESAANYAGAPAIADDEVAAAAAAAAEAVGVVVRLLATSVSNSILGAVHYVMCFLSDFASGILGLSETFTDTSASSADFYEEHDEEASGSSIHLVACFLATSGVIFVLFSIFLSQARPADAAHEAAEGSPMAIAAPLPAHNSEAYRPSATAAMPMSPLPSKLASAPSPPPLHQAAFPSPLHLPVEYPTPDQGMEPIRAVVRSPIAAPVPAAPPVAATASSGARTLMALMGRTPGTVLPAAAGASYAEAPPRRAPPPPASLVQEPISNVQLPPPQVNACYVEVAPFQQERVVRVVAVRGDVAYVQPHSCNRSRGGRITFSRSRDDESEVMVEVANLKDGPFHIATGGRAPQFIVSRFGGAGKEYPTVPEFSEGNRFTTPMPTRTPMTGDLLKSRFVLEEPRFRYTASLNKLKDMGYPDNSRLREVINKYSGDVGRVIQEINGSPLRGERA